jgi:hypothetical protein
MLLLAWFFQPVRLRLLILLFALVSGSLVVAQEANEREIEDVMVLPPFRVESAPLEDFGFRIGGQFAIPGTSYLMVSEVLPNTAAAKAGLRPGELITKMDGKSVSVLSTLLKPKKLQERKWAELEAGKKSVTYSLEVHAPGSATSRTVTMVIPSPAPHWGSKTWSAPEGRLPITVKEAGPLAALAREVSDNGIWAMAVFRSVSLLGAASVSEAPILGYEWRIVQPSGTHRIWVT